MEKLPPISPSETRSQPSAEASKRIAEAKRCAQRLLGCYRTGDANDPETYIAAVVSVLAQYPVWIIENVTEPATGLPSRLKWLPSVAEVKEACSNLDIRESAAMRYAREWEAGAQRLLEQRDALRITDGKPRKTYEQIQAELAEVGIFIGQRKAAPIDIGAFRAKYGISQAQWDAIPNAK